MLLSFLLKELSVLEYAFIPSLLFIFLILLHFLCYVYIYMHACVWLWACHNIHVEIKGQHWGITSFLLLCLCYWLNSVLQAWQQALTYSELLPRLNVYLSLSLYFILSLFLLLLPQSVRLSFVSRTETKRSSITESFVSVRIYLYCREQCYCLQVVCTLPDRCNWCRNFYQPSYNHRLLLNVDLLLTV